jgi:hypothetical protein
MPGATVLGLIFAVPIWQGWRMADPFIERVADQLMAVPGVLAVHFGGSRAAGNATPDSDWDSSIYYRQDFDVGGIRALGWPGTITEIGGWGPVMNGGAWLTVDGKNIDIHYRDLEEIDHLQVDAEAGHFTVYRSPFFIAGLPSYVPLAELATGELLRGELPVPEMPIALRRGGSAWWRGEAAKDLGYASTLVRSSSALTLGLLARIIVEVGHAVFCERGQWTTNEKRLVEVAGLREVEGELIGRLRDGQELFEIADWLAGALGLRPFNPR